MYKKVKGQEGIEWLKPPRLRSDLEMEGPTKRVRGRQSKNSKRVCQVTEQERIFPFSECKTQLLSGQSGSYLEQVTQTRCILSISQLA